MIFTNPLQVDNWSEWFMTHESYLKKVWNEILMNGVEEVTKELESEYPDMDPRDLETAIIAQIMCGHIFDMSAEEFEQERNENENVDKFLTMTESMLHLWNLEDKDIVSISEDGKVTLNDNTNI